MMKKLIAILCLCVCCSLFFVGCGEKTDGSMEPIKDETGNITGYERKYHNENGDITRWDVYDVDQQYEHYILYEYNSNGLLGKETYYQADGIGVYYYAYSYDESGNMAEKDYVSAKDGSTRTLYDSDGNESERYTFDKQDQLSMYEVYQNGTWVESEPPTQPETEDMTE